MRGTGRIRLVTYNVHHGVGDDRRHDLPRLATVLADADADVVCLQEVDRHFGDRSEDVDQPLLLSRGLGMHLAWGPAIEQPRRDGGPDRQYGNALLSRRPVLGSEVHPLPGTGEPRSALSATVDLDGVPLRITVTHLSKDPAARAAQVAVLAGLHDGGDLPAVLVGDVNTRPDAPELAPLRERLTDAWELAPDRDDQAGWRFWHRDHGDTFPASAARTRIDHVWVSAGVRVHAARVLPGGGASDHLPLAVDLEVEQEVPA